MEIEERKGLRVKDLLIRLILIVIFIFLLIWLFPQPNLKPLNSQIFLDNIERMKDVAKTYYTVERLPENINDYKKMTLGEMIDNKLILPLVDSNGKYCKKDTSYIQITKLENEYIIKVYLSCSDKQDYIIEHFGCYDICSDKCKMLATTQRTTHGKIITPTHGSKKQTTKQIFESTKQMITTAKANYLYEYQFSRNNCKDNFAGYKCNSGYYLVGDKCIKNGSKVETISATAKTTNTISTDTKDAKAVVTKDSKKVDAIKSIKYEVSAMFANKNESLTDQVVTKIQTITADKKTTYDVKVAIGTKETITSSYQNVQNYDVITATKYATSSGWSYVATRISSNGALAYSNDSEKLVLVGSWQELECASCFSTVTLYKYYHYKKVYSGVKYSCDAFPGYSLYDTDKCRKATNITKSCPSGYKDNGKNCVKENITYSCSSYGSSYKLDSSKKTCTKETVSYSCPSGTTKTSNQKYCDKKVYGCPSGTTSNGNGKCVKTTYSCPSNTASTSYTLIGNMCAVKSAKTVYTCPSGTTKSQDERYCVKQTSNTKYTCDDYPGYTLVSNKCTKVTTTPKTVYTCPSSYTLNNSSCVKTVNTTDSKNAQKEYKTSCNLEYKWTNKTSLSGWSYTGNKRLINE